MSHHLPGFRNAPRHCIGIDETSISMWSPLYPLLILQKCKLDVISPIIILFLSTWTLKELVKRLHFFFFFAVPLVQWPFKRLEILKKFGITISAATLWVPHLNLKFSKFHQWSDPLRDSKFWLFRSTISSVTLWITRNFGSTISAATLWETPNLDFCSTMSAVISWAPLASPRRLHAPRAALNACAGVMDASNPAAVASSKTLIMAGTLFRWPSACTPYCWPWAKAVQWLMRPLSD